MDVFSDDQEFINITSFILNNDDFMKTKECIHHGLTRYDHSLRVSYYSYKMCKFLKLDARETAIAGLLHDFFLAKNDNKKERFQSFFRHPKVALDNADSHFFLTDKEKDIIESHMFPVIPTKPPKYLESWVVSLVDKFVAAYEFSLSFSKYKFATNSLVVALIFSKMI